MELAAAAFSGLSSAVSSIGTAATSLFSGGTAAAGTAAAVGGASPWLSALQLGLGGLSALSTINAGNEKADQLLASAADADSAAVNERVTGTERRASLKRQAAESMAEKQAAYAAGGVDLSFGTPTIARAQDTRDAEHALAIDQGTEDQRVARNAERAAQFRAAASKAKSNSLMKAFLQGGETLLAVNRRG